MQKMYLLEQTSIADNPRSYIFEQVFVLFLDGRSHDKQILQGSFSSYGPS